MATKFDTKTTITRLV